MFSRVVGSLSAPAYRSHHNEEEVQDEPSVVATADAAELSEARSLRKFHRVMGGKGWRRKNGWGAANTDAPQFRLTDYDGVTVGPGGRVEKIRLRDNNLSAFILLRHPEYFPWFNRWSYLSGLRFLTVLDLSNNSLRGILTLEEVDLSHNSFFGMIPESIRVNPALHQLPRLTRLRLNDNDLSGFIPKQIKHMANLELLDCSNNDISGKEMMPFWRDFSDLLPAWACVAAIHASAEDPHPREMCLFIMDAPPKLMEGVSEPTRKAQAQIRADEWMRWHLAQKHHQPRAMYLGEVQVEMVALPQHDKAQVRFCVNLGSGENHPIEFGKDRALPRAVFGRVTDATGLDKFNHVVVAVNVEKICLFVVWALVACCLATYGIVFNTGFLTVLVSYLMLNLPMDLLLARYGVRPARALWPFYRMLGYQGCKVPTLTLTIGITDGGEQV
eukprot:g10145.t2